MPGTNTVGDIIHFYQSGSTEHILSNSGSGHANSNIIDTFVSNVSELSERQATGLKFWPRFSCKPLLSQLYIHLTHCGTSMIFLPVLLKILNRS